jgi:hypothetical protein
MYGRYALQDVDTLTLTAGPQGSTVLRGADGTTDALRTEDDSTLFEERDGGSWKRPSASIPAGTSPS